MNSDPHQLELHLDLMIDAFNNVDASGLLELRGLDPGGNKPAIIKLFDLAQKQQAMTAALQWNLDRNVYVGLNPRGGTTPRNKAGVTADCTMSILRAADLDSAESVLTLKTYDSGPPFTWVVVTGTQPHQRAQPYWQVEHPTSLEAFTVDQKILQHRFGGDPISDAPRIVRLAGLINYPSEKKRARGYIPELITIVDHSDEHSPIDPIEFRGFINGYDPTNDTNFDSIDLGQAAGRSMADIKALLELSQTDGDWHPAMLRATASMVGKRMTDAEIRDLCSAYCDGGRLDEDLDVLVQGARTHYSIPDPATVQAEEKERVFHEPGPEDAATWTTQPPDRRWLVEHWLPEGKVSSLYGDGGLGKTLLKQLLGTCIATGTAFYGNPVSKRPALLVLCEDDKDELQRRQISINKWLGVIPAPGMLQIWSRSGYDNILARFDSNTHHFECSHFYERVQEEIARLDRPFVGLDTLADIFGGNEVDRYQANQFIKSVLGRWCVHQNATILVSAHPSLAQAGTGSSGSTAWNAAVRNRWFMQMDGPEPTEVEDRDRWLDRRKLTRAKANYSKKGAQIDLIYDEEHSVFTADIPDANPVGMALQSIKRAVWDEIAKAAEINNHYKLSLQSSNPIRKARIILFDKVVSAANITRVVEQMLQSEVIENKWDRKLRANLLKTVKEPTSYE